MSASTPEPSASWVNGFIGSIGNTPLIRLDSLSKATGCTILGKCEHMNPGGSIKDRAAAYIIDKAIKDGSIAPGGTIVEATAGNTGIGLALVGKSHNLKALFTMPADMAKEKVDTLRTLGAEVILVPGTTFADPNHFFHSAARIASERPGHFFTNQFENLANFQSHYEGTGPEIWKQTGGKIDGFICSAGTGGTIGGISTYLREQSPTMQLYLIDPPGSGMHSFLKEGEFIKDGSSTLEGIGILRKTENFSKAIPQLSGSFKGQDQEAVAMAHHLLRKDGLFLGGSAAFNCVGAVKLARLLGPGHTIVTVLCDGGRQYQSKLYNDEWLREKGFTVPSEEEAEGLSFVL